MAARGSLNKRVTIFVRNTETGTCLAFDPQDYGMPYPRPNPPVRKYPSRARRGVRKNRGLS